MGACLVVLAVFGIPSAATNARQPRPMPTEMRIGLLRYFADRETGFRPRECIEREAHGRGRKPTPRKIVCNDPSGSRRKSATRLRGD